MKKLLCLLLAALTLLSCACAATPEADQPDAVIASEELVDVSANHSRELRENPSDKGYIRYGRYADMTWREINAEIGTDTNNAEPFDLKEDVAHDYTRRVYFTFDLTNIDQFDYKKIFFMPSFTWTDVSLPSEYTMYRVDPDAWDGDTLTWNTAPKQGEPIARGAARAMGQVDLTKVINEMLAEGETVLSFVMIMDKGSGHNQLNSKTCALVATTSDEVGTYVYQLVEDEVENKKIWDYAEKLFNEWFARYMEIKNKPLPEVKLIESDPDEWNKIVYSGGSGFGNWTLENVNKPYPTRTYEALDDLGDYTDYDREMVFDVYGGWMNPEMRQEATGFFYSTKIGDRWWFIDPLGYPCHIRAMHSVNVNYLGSQNQYNEAMKLYGSEEKWQIAVCNWLKNDLYFNTVDAQSGFKNVEGRMVLQSGAPSFAGGYGGKVGVSAGNGGSTMFAENNTMPILEPGFVEYCDEKAKVVANYKDDPWRVGYTTDNELPMNREMLQNYLSLDYSKPVNHYSYAAAWTWLCNMTGKENPTGNDIDDELLELFRGFVWDRYFNVVSAALKKYDPNHMFMGTRFLHGVAEAEWVCRFAALYLDCVTINWYGQWTIDAQLLYDVCRVMDLPMMITEFYTKGLENDGSFDDPTDPLKNTRGAGWIVRTQQDRGDFYENYTLRLLECKNMIGWHWHMYLDDDDSPEVIYKNGKDGEWRDQSNIDANKGIVNNWHQPYEELCASMAQINGNVYRLIEHFDAKYAD